MNDEPLIIEQEYNAPVELVWRAITEKELMKQWYFDIADFKLEVGCTFSFEGGKDDRCYIHLCEILEIVPLKKLKYSWKYEGYAGLTFVTFELFPIENKTKLRLTHEGIGTLPPDNPDLVRGNFVEGWTFLIHQSLKEFTEKKKPNSTT